MNLLTKIQNHLKSSKNPIIVLLGPTASGKTKLSLKLAKKINAEILSTDSRQVYKEMPIATDALSKEDQEGVIHHFLEIISPNQVITLADYIKKSNEIIEKIYRESKVPMLVGGTGLYVSALIEGYKLSPHSKDLQQKIRTDLEAELEEKGQEFLYQRLLKLNPEKAKTFHPNNHRYLVRALEKELIKKENEGLTSQNKEVIESNFNFSPFLIGIDWPRKELYQRIEERVDLQIEKGLLDEVKNLLQKGYSEKLPAMTSLGIKEIIPYIKGEIDLQEALNILKRNTRRYAKRQLTWFRRYDDINWIDNQDIPQIIQTLQEN